VVTIPQKRCAVVFSKSASRHFWNLLELLELAEMPPDEIGSA
jgi:hypothetical protein